MVEDGGRERRAGQEALQPLALAVPHQSSLSVTAAMPLPSATVTTAR
jgi:hypothetical protein